MMPRHMWPDWAEGTHWPNLSSQSAGHSEYGCAAWKTEGGGEAAVKLLFASNGLAQAAVPACEPRLRARYECTRTATKEAPAERFLLLTRWCRCGCRSAKSEETGRSAGNPRMLDMVSGFDLTRQGHSKPAFFKREPKAEKALFPAGVCRCRTRWKGCPGHIATLGGLETKQIRIIPRAEAVRKIVAETRHMVNVDG